MPYAYTGGIDDVQAMDVYLAAVMDWINELKVKYGISDV